MERLGEDFYYDEHAVYKTEPWYWARLELPSGKMYVDVWFKPVKPAEYVSVSLVVSKSGVEACDTTN
jgi:hypothetical protein